MSKFDSKFNSFLEKKNNQNTLEDFIKKYKMICRLNYKSINDEILKLLEKLKDMSEDDYQMFYNTVGSISYRTIKDSILYVNKAMDCNDDAENYHRACHIIATINDINMHYQSAIQSSIMVPTQRTYESIKDLKEHHEMINILVDDKILLDKARSLVEEKINTYQGNSVIDEFIEYKKSCIEKDILNYLKQESRRIDTIIGKEEYGIYKDYANRNYMKSKQYQKKSRMPGANVYNLKF